MFENTAFVAKDFLFLVTIYSFCSLNPALWVSFYLKKDILSQGSGNPGATNVVRLFGLRLGALVFLFDFLKPYLAYQFFLQFYLPSSFALQAFPFLAISGHCYSLWHQGTGGKGVATYLGVLLTLNFAAFIGALAVWCLLFSLKRISAAASLGSIFCSLFILPKSLFIPCLCPVLLIFFKHWPNIKEMFLTKNKYS